MPTKQEIIAKVTAMHGVVKSIAVAVDELNGEMNSISEEIGRLQAIIDGGGTVDLTDLDAKVVEVSAAISALLPAIQANGGPPPPPPGPAKPPLYPSSVTGTDFDYITDADPNAFVALAYLGSMQFEMPDKRGGPLFQQAYVFNATFTGGNGRDGTGIKIACSNLFGSQSAAQTDAMRYTSRLGKLPSLYRRNINHIVVHTGGVDPAGTTAFAEDQGHFFVIYSENATVRIGTHDLEETFFHESSHAAIQVDHLTSAEWLAAVAADNAFITNYASTDEQEDFAESALFAYTMIHHPERFPEPDRTNIATQIPNRIEFFAGLDWDQ